MIILSHRGCWTVPDEKNSAVAFKRSFDLGFGTETDIRDSAGCLVISHDIPVGNEIHLVDFLQFYKKSLPLALNIKSDGLVVPLKHAMQTAGILDWFVFDMSIPEMRSYLKAGIPVFARMSEVEKDPAWIDEVAGIWLDSFSDIWYDTNLIDKLLNKGLRVCIVSPELHGREHKTFWTELTVLSRHTGLMLCTDFPEQAKDFFKVKIK